MINRKNVLLIGTLVGCAVLVVFGSDFLNVNLPPHPSKHDASPGSGLGTDPASNLPKTSEVMQNETAAPPNSIQKDPFKAFLEGKATSTPLGPSSQNAFVPGTDPFKAKLEEQKNAPHSAVSPFKN